MSVSPADGFARSSTGAPQLALSGVVIDCAAAGDAAAASNPAPTNELARRSRDLAVRYNGEAKDLLYKIYVKYLPLRQAV